MQWTIGNVTIQTLVETTAQLPVASFLPEATPQELDAISWLREPFVTPDHRVVLSIQALLVTTPSRRVIVDTCNGNDKPRPDGFGHMQQTDFLDRLTAAGFGRQDVDIVLCTHMHVDHVGWNTMLEGDQWVPTFPRARYLVSKAEFAHASHPTREGDAQIFRDSIAPVQAAGLYDLVEADHRLSDEIRLVPTPGHTPGHVSVEITSQGQRALITGDFMHSPAQIARPDWATFVDHDRAQSTATRHTMLSRLAADGTLVIGTHFPAPTAGTISTDGSAYRFNPQGE